MSAKPKIFIGLPIRRDVSALFMNAMIGLACSKDFQFQVAQEIGCPWVGAARNALTGDFLESNCSNIFFCDDDVIPDARHIATLYARQVPIVTGFYAKKHDGALEWAHCGWNKETGEHLGPMVQLRYAGAGYVLIAREVFEKIKTHDKYLRSYKEGSLRDGRSLEYDFWSQGVYPGGDTWLGEDAYFFQRATDCGFRIWGDTSVVPSHIGQVAFPLRHQREALFAAMKAEEKPEPVTINQG